MQWQMRHPGIDALLASEVDAGSYITRVGGVKNARIEWNNANLIALISVFRSSQCWRHQSDALRSAH